MNFVSRAINADALIVIGAIVVAICLVVLFVTVGQIREAAAARRHEAWRRREEIRRQEYLKQQMQKLALTCDHRAGGCGKLAQPIPGTGNRYRCEHCGRQFVQAKHNL